MNGFISLRAEFRNQDLHSCQEKREGSMCTESVSKRLVSGWEDAGQPGKVAAPLAISGRYPAKENTAAGPQRFIRATGSKLMTRLSKYCKPNKTGIFTQQSKSTIYIYQKLDLHPTPSSGWT